MLHTAIPFNIMWTARYIKLLTRLALKNGGHFIVYAEEEEKELENTKD